MFPYHPTSGSTYCLFFINAAPVQITLHVKMTFKLIGVLVLPWLGRNGWIGINSLSNTCLSEAIFISIGGMLQLWLCGILLLRWREFCSRKELTLYTRLRFVGSAARYFPHIYAASISSSPCQVYSTEPKNRITFIQLSHN